MKPATIYDAFFGVRLTSRQKQALLKAAGNNPYRMSEVGRQIIIEGLKRRGIDPGPTPQKEQTKK